MPGGASRSPTGQAIGARTSMDLGRIHSRSTEAAMFRRSTDAGDMGDTGTPASPTSTTSGGTDDRAARALARFTVQVNPRHRGALSAGSDAELLANAADGNRAFGRSSSARIHTVSPVQRQPLSPRQQQQRADDEFQRALRTMTLIPRRPNTEMARVWEGIPQQQQQQQQGPADGSSGQQQQQQTAGGGSAAGVRLSKLGYEEGSRIYSDEEVQAVAAALPEPLTVQQQRLLADLLRLKRVSFDHTP